MYLARVARERLPEEVGHERVESVTDRREDTAVGVGRGVGSRLWSVMQGRLPMRIRSTAGVPVIQDRSVLHVVLPLFPIYNDMLICITLPSRKNT